MTGLDDHRHLLPDPGHSPGTPEPPDLDVEIPIDSRDLPEQDVNPDAAMTEPPD